MTGDISIAFSPAVPWWAIGAALAAGAALVAVALKARAPGA